MIWSYALPGRILLVEPLRPHSLGPSKEQRAALLGPSICQKDETCRSLPPPGMAFACQEARAVMKQDSVGKAYPIKAMNSNPNLHGRWTWFDPERDVLCINSWAYEPYSESPGRTSRQGLHRPPRPLRIMDLSSFSSTIETVCLSLTALQQAPRVIVNDLTDQSLCPRLERFLFFETTLVIHVAAGVDIPPSLFPRSDHVALVSAQDHARIRMFRGFYEKYAMGCDVNTHQQLCSLADPSGSESRAKSMLIRLRDTWVDVHWLSLPPTSPMASHTGLKSIFNMRGPHMSQSQYDHEHPWVQEVLSTMPDFELVVQFRLCQAAVHEHASPSSTRGGGRGSSTPIVV
ncbi:hypothetical protein JX265_003812 [Neoarthrinium moseri]|uniref:2EXR domain-containing protein n=1 Tax=Neoarthrinium moseri TaxID=1658444 RepID=A0A9Q0ATV1_9PEZI|nr:hypothetical protein JX265_003812 [Neoarthrinium moseri]